MSFATPDKPFSADYCQHGNGTTLKTFSSAQDAIAFAQGEWESYRSHPEHTRGGSLRGEWSVFHHTFDSDGEMDDGENLWRGQADGV